jgi:hypothetical protein
MRADLSAAGEVEERRLVNAETQLGGNWEKVLKGIF